MKKHEIPHRRFNPLTGEWVLVSPHRTKRPWQGQNETPQCDTGLAYDEKCFLCPGNERAQGDRNPDYEGTYVFTNDYAALLPGVDSFSETKGPNGLLHAASERGICRVVCFSPRHDLTLSRMEVGGIAGVIRTWTDEYEELGSRPEINHVQIFENRGAVMGCSNPHPHGQIWAEEVIPTLPALELKHQDEYFKTHGTSMLLDYLRYEKEQKERIVLSNEYFSVLVPYWAVWPFETMILPHRDLPSLSECTGEEVISLASIMKELGVKYDNLFKTSFPYSMGIHQLPTDGKRWEGAQFHMHYLPPLLRSADVKKFMVGYELLAQPQRDITAEMSAHRLRELSSIHYMEVL